jgi:Na+/melibiose symporter-like transporter
MAIFYALLWAVPDASFPGGRAIYYVLIYFLFDAAYTLVSGPYYALTPELSLDSDERTSIVTYRMAVSIVTGLMAAVALQVVFEKAASMQEAFLSSAIVVGALSALPYLLIGAFFRERSDFQSPKAQGFRRSVQSIVRNRPFWIALLLYWLAWLAIRIVEAVFAYFLINWSGIPEADTAYVLAIILASAALFLPVVGYLARRMEKKWAFAACCVFWACLHLALWWVPKDTAAPVYVIAFLAGLGVSAAHVLPNAMGADVLEVIELETGERQEGIYGGVSSFIQKLGTALAVLAIGWTLEWTGYVPGAQQQSAAALTGIRVLTSWVPLLLLVGSALLSAAFPLTRSSHRALTEEVNRRRLQRIAESPSGLAD